MQMGDGLPPSRHSLRSFPGLLAQLRHARLVLRRSDCYETIGQSRILISAYLWLCFAS
jgi:hypothetical protein